MKAKIKVKKSKNISNFLLIHKLLPITGRNYEVEIINGDVILIIPTNQLSQMIAFLDDPMMMVSDYIGEMIPHKLPPIEFKILDIFNN